MAYTFDQRFLDIPVCRPLSALQMTQAQEQKLNDLIAFIWTEQDHAVIKKQLCEIITEAQARLLDNLVSGRSGWSQKQVVLICYGDHIRSREPGKTPLQALSEFCREQFFEEVFANLTIHLLPIYASPYKDGGFDIADPFAVNPAMGTWEDVRCIRQHFRVAVDFVANHLSIASQWFERYMQDDPVYQDFFIGFDDQQAVQEFQREFLPKIYRPRPHNPLITVKKPDGSTRWVYMTFSHQPDINYHKPFVFLKMTEVLFFYILQGVTMVRLDAIPYLWKEWGTSCAHHPKTHALTELFRLATDLLNPAAKLLAESMEPLADSMRYLSTERQAKAHLAYNFVPCGLIPHALITEDVSVFQQNLLSFRPPHKEVNWAVVCGVTHDGSSMNPCRAPKSISGEAVLTEEQINRIAEYYTQHGRRELKIRTVLDSNDPHFVRPDYTEKFIEAHNEQPRFVNYKTVVDGQGEVRQIVYEAISTYGSLFDQNPEKIVAALGMALALPGIPFIYLTLPFAILNNFEYYLQTGNPRELNRGRVLLEDLLQDLANQESLAHKVFSVYKKLLRLRVSHPAFHPDGKLIPLTTGNTAIMSFIRVSPDDTQLILVLQNVSSAPQEVDIALTAYDALTTIVTCRDLVSELSYSIDDHKLHLVLQSLEIKWCQLS